MYNIQVSLPDQAPVDLEALDLSQLETVCRQVIETLKARRRVRTRLLATSWRPGQAVTFRTGRGLTVVGRVQKVNQTTATVYTPMTKAKWRVALGLLHAPTPSQLQALEATGD